MRQEGTTRNDNFYFLSFFAFSNLFWLEMTPQWCFFIFYFYFFAIFLEYSIMRQVGTERNETKIFHFLLSHPPSTYGGLKWSHNGIF